MTLQFESFDPRMRLEWKSLEPRLRFALGLAAAGGFFCAPLSVILLLCGQLVPASIFGIGGSCLAIGCCLLVIKMNVQRLATVDALNARTDSLLEGVKLQTLTDMVQRAMTEERCRLMRQSELTERKLVWRAADGKILYRHSDGGAGALTEEDAHKMRRQLGDALQAPPG